MPHKSLNLEMLREPFKTMIRMWLHETTRRGFKISIVEALRSKQYQEAIYAQGREPLDKVNELRRQVGLPPIKESENRQVSWTLDSPHLFGCAIDFVPIVNGKADWNNKTLFTQVGQIAEEFGLEWGGRWKVNDYPHIELKNWRKYRDLFGWTPVLN